jgi:hypothetical protein
MGEEDLSIETWWAGLLVRESVVRSEVLFVRAE